MRVDVGTMLDAPAETVWAHLLTSALLAHVCHPLISFTPIEPAALPERWEEGDYLVGMRAFGLIPLGRQWIRIRLGHEGGWPRTVRDNGGGQLVARWDHRISIEPADGGRTRYRDTVEVEAGLLTPFIWVYAQLFYRHRQRRWRGLARSGFVALPTPAPAIDPRHPLR